MASHIAKSSNPIILKAGVHIGEPAAEDDDQYLFDCFINHPSLDEVTDFSVAKCILLGRTGTGKTAIARKIVRDNNHAIQIDPFEASFSYISNSNIIKYFESLGVNMILFYQLLWKHIICVEILQHVYEIKSKNDQETLLARLAGIFDSDPRKKLALDYVRKWHGEFWLGYDVRLKEITRQFENDLSAAGEAVAPGFKVSGEYAQRASEETKHEITERAQRVVNDIQMRELNEVINLIGDVLNEKMRDYYVVIDKLDEHWTEKSSQMYLIRALIESIKTFRKIERLKIVLCVRADLYERVMAKTKEIGFQSEKYEGIISRIGWTKSNLFKLADSRIKEMFRRQYTNDKVGFYAIFPDAVRKINTFDFIFERTLKRPRDVIAFVNEAIDKADGKSKITEKSLRDAEFSYSRKRLLAVKDEWSENYPYIDHLQPLFSNGKQTLSYEDILNSDGIDEAALKICAEFGMDSLPPWIRDVFERQDARSREAFIKNAVGVFYRIGVLGIKFNSQSRSLFADIDEATQDTDSITPETKMLIHPTFWRVLNVTPNI